MSRILLVALATAVTIIASGGALAQKQYLALSTGNETVNVKNMTLESAREQFMAAWNHTKFNATFSSFIEPLSSTGFGVYKEHSNLFRPGEEIVLHVEPVGYNYKPVVDDKGNTLYMMNMSADFLISSPNGTKLQSVNDVPAVNIVSHRTNTELSLDLTLTQQQPFPAGDYIIRYVIIDKVSGESFKLDKQIKISGNSTLNGTNPSPSTSAGSGDNSAGNEGSSSSRCPNGYHRSPSGECEIVTDTGGLPRCPNGFHRSPSGICESVR